MLAMEMAAHQTCPRHRLRDAKSGKMNIVDFHQFADLDQFVASIVAAPCSVPYTLVPSFDATIDMMSLPNSRRGWIR